MLGMIHKTVLEKGVPQLKKWFRASSGPNHSHCTRFQENLRSKQLHDYLDGTHTSLLRRSALGLPRVYNKLPAEVVACRSVKDFQREFQKRVKETAQQGYQTGKFSTA